MGQKKRRKEKEQRSTIGVTIVFTVPEAVTTGYAQKLQHLCLQPSQLPKWEGKVKTEIRDQKRGERRRQNKEKERGLFFGTGRRKKNLHWNVKEKKGYRAEKKKQRRREEKREKKKEGRKSNKRENRQRHCRKQKNTGRGVNSTSITCLHRHLPHHLQREHQQKDSRTKTVEGRRKKIQKKNRQTQTAESRKNLIASRPGKLFLFSSSFALVFLAFGTVQR